MKMAPFVLLFGCAVAVGWYAPQMIGNTGNAPDRILTVSDSPNRKDMAKGTSQWLAGQTVLTREADGHFYTQASVSGTPIHFLVDTGASVVALTNADAAAIGLDWETSSVKPVGRGASGPVHGVPVTLDRVEINGLEANNVQAVIIPEGLHVSLLGQSFLSHIETVEISGDQMRLGS